MEYRFRAPAGPARTGPLEIRLRASSELPGAGGDASHEDVSRLRLSIDGVELGELEAPPDDGLGEWITLRVDAASVPRLSRARVHTLRIAADGTGAGGLCLYAEDERGAPAGIELRRYAASEPPP